MRPSRSPGPRRLGTILATWLAVPLATLAIGLLLLEIVFRFLPVNEGCRTPSVDASQPMMFCAPNRTFTWSRFADFAMTNRVRANNIGAINDQDYVADSPLPLLAVVGDSIVEALMVPYGQTVHGRLASAAEGRARVYSFAASGAHLGQYLAYLEYARDRFKPSAAIVVVTPNDYANSLRRRLAAPGMHSFVEDGRGGFELRRFDFTSGRLASVVRQSRLLMYLALNVDLSSRGLSFFRPTVANAAAASVIDPEALADGRLAIDLFINRVEAAAGVPAARIALVVDGPRPIPLVRAAATTAVQSGGTDRELNAYLSERARERGLIVLDAEEVFLARQSTPPVPLEFPYDTHWTGDAHRLIADGVLATGLLQALPPPR